jgi:DNA-binding Lrp family transcriptional regulator
LSKADVRIDRIDLQILKILTYDCRTSYRSIGKTLGISANTARARIHRLILNKTIEQFTTLVNFSLFGYSDVITLIIKVDKNNQPHNIIDKVSKSKSKKDYGPIYMHIEALNGIHAFGIAIDDTHVNIRSISSLEKNLSKVLGKSITILDIFFGKHSSFVSDKLHLRRIDLEILECLLLDPRMTFFTIARTLGCSQKTVIRRFEKLKSCRAIMGFSLIHNPSKMKGYNYFSVILHTRPGMATDIMREISYSELNESILRLPAFVFEDRVIVNFHIENVFDIESLVRKIKSIKGVVRTEAYQPIRIKWHQQWLHKKIRNKIVTI